MNLLCRFGHRFPQLAAKILERESGKTRNFREETITDLLMAGLVPFEPFQIMTDFPVNESATGEDMDWEFVNEHALDGRKYLRLHIQAKRAHHSGTKRNPYWLYRSLDHAVNPPPPKGTPKPPKGTPKPPPQYGNQHKTLLDEAARLGSCVPLYIFYHPASALVPACGSLPAVEGVNWMFADLVPVNVSTKAWPIDHKKLENWRSHFQPLHRLLCFGHAFGPITVTGPSAEFSAFLIPDGAVNPTPGELEDMLNGLRDPDEGVCDRIPIRASQSIPPTTLAAMAAVRDGGRMPDLPRKRAIFVTSDPR
ncbi:MULTISPECIES: DUF6615 family protein [Bacteria]|uniref:DUF6615 family protein n=1 Tax=Bacteria TaxID=2 RepID=UPI0010574996|nr:MULTISPECIES: DUF6615 family protein [Bacteria]